MAIHRGFTLIELLITIAVAGVITVMVAPSFLGLMDRQELNRSARELALALAEGRSQAALKNIAVTVTISPASKNLPNTVNTIYWSPSGKAVLKPATEVTIVFQGNGSVAAATSFKVCDSKNAKSKIITVSKIGSTMQTDGACT